MSGHAAMCPEEVKAMAKFCHLRGAPVICGPDCPLYRKDREECSLKALTWEVERLNEAAFHILEAIEELMAR